MRLTCFSHPVLAQVTVAPPRWQAAPLSVIALSDLHLSWPWSTPEMLRKTVARINALTPDLILLPGDFIAPHRMPGLPVPIETTAEILSNLTASLGVFATLGNHDWRDCRKTRATGHTLSHVAKVLHAHGIPVLQNTALPIRDFWLVGTDSLEGQGSTRRPAPHIDMEQAFAQVPKGATALLAAHEPDIFADADPRVALQVSGHTHAGQANLWGWRPLTPSRHGGRYAHGLISEGEGRLVVSSGWGFSGLPLRLNAPPEITRITIS